MHELDHAIELQIQVEQAKEGYEEEIALLLLSLKKTVTTLIEYEELSELAPTALNRRLVSLRREIADTFLKQENKIMMFVERASGIVATREASKLREMYLGKQLSVPSPEELKAYVKRQIMQSSGQDLKAYVRTEMKREAARVSNAINRLSRRLSNQEIVRAINGTQRQPGLLKSVERGIRAAERTAMQHSAVAAKDALYLANSELVERVIFIAVLDNKTTPICRTLDKTVYPVGVGPRPPMHPNCLSGDTNVLSGSRISNIYKRRYEGIICEIKTASGRSIKVTPNHPILTGRGWKAAGELDCTDQVACIGEPSFIPDNKKDCVKAKFSDLFTALDVSVDPSCVTSRPSTPEDFHGDGSNGDVSIVNIDSFGWNRFREGIGNNIKNVRFVDGSGVDFTLSGLSSEKFFGSSGSSASNSIMSFFSEMSYLLRRGVLHPDELLLAAIPFFESVSCKGFFNRPWGRSKLFSYTGNAHSLVEQLNNVRVAESLGCSFGSAEDFDAGIFENSADSSLIDAKLAADLLNGKSGTVQLDRVVSNLRSNFSSHVYNLENSDNWYLSNGIITHNCRSTVAPYSEGMEDQPTYYEWLRERPRSYIEGVLGVGRTKVFLADDMTPEKFARLNLNRRFRQITLDEWERLI